MTALPQHRYPRSTARMYVPHICLVIIQSRAGTSPSPRMNGTMSQKSGAPFDNLYHGGSQMRGLHYLGLNCCGLTVDTVLERDVVVDQNLLLKQRLGVNSHMHTLVRE